MTSQEIMRLVNRYIGVGRGYLGDFSYRTHEEFYPEYCNLEINPYEYDGTTRERFISILSTQPPENQARIIRGILEKYPEASVKEQTEVLRGEFEMIALRLERESAPATLVAPTFESRSAVVRQALHDAELLITTNGAIRAVDRVHTALHGYLREICVEAQISVGEDTAASRLLTLLLQQHPVLVGAGSRPEETRKILRSLAGTIDALGTARNLASPAHPNDVLLDEPEAQLAIAAAYAIIGYIESRFRRT